MHRIKSILRSVFTIFLHTCITFTLCAQEQPLQQRLTFNFDNIKLKDALIEIENMSDVSFSYSSRKIPVDTKVKLSVNDETLSIILDLLFQQLDLSYQLIEGKIIIKKNRKNKSDRYTINGYLRDKSDGESLLGATVLVKELGDGVISNAFGFYSITLPVGRYTLHYSYIGYKDIIKTIELSSDHVIDVELDQSVAQLAEIVISPGDSAVTLDNIRDNVFALKQEIVNNKTAALGESDVVKALEVVPGVQLFRDGSTFFNVRGGDRDQNQILVDDAPIYNPAHLLGLFSSIIPESTKAIKLYRGDLPAEFGGRISSVLDIKTRDGNLNKTSINGSAGFIAGRFAIEGPIKKEKSSYFVSGRRSYLFELLQTDDSDVTSLFFSDFSAKANLKINRKNRLYISTYIGRDEFLSDGGITWRNDAATIRWNKVFSENLFANFTLYSSSYEYKLISPPNITWSNDINNASIKADFIKYIGLNSTLKFGFRISGHSFNPGNVEDSTGNIPDDQPFVPKRNATEFSHYISKDQKIGSNLLLTYGARLSSWSNIGKTIEYEIDDEYAITDTIVYDNRNEYNNYTNLEPRISLTWLYNRKNTFKLNYSRSAQYINLISNSISPFNNLEVWMPASLNIKPQLADQISTGWFHRRERWGLSFEGYYKWMYNQIDYANQAKLLLNPTFEAELRTGRGWAYGMELKLEKNTGNIRGWVSYAYSRSLRKIDGINEGRTYPALWDRPHQLALNGSWITSPRTTISSTLYVSSGIPTTTPTSFYTFSDRIVPIYSDRNNSRLPVYHRYDISLKWKLNKKVKKYNHYLTFAIFNFYAQKNSILNNFNKIRLEDDTYVVPTDSNNPSEIEPTTIFVYSVIPSVTYSFKL